MPKGGIYSQLRRDRRSRNTSAICWCFYEKMGQLFVGLLDLRLEDIPCSTSCQQEVFGRKTFCRNKFSRAGVWSRKSRKFLSCENFPLCGTCTRPEMLSPSSCYYSRNVPRMKPLYMVRRTFSKPFVVGKKKPPTRCQTAFYCRYPKQLPCAQHPTKMKSGSTVK